MNKILLIILASCVLVGCGTVRETPLKAKVFSSHQQSGWNDDDRVYVICEDGEGGVVHGILAPVGSDILVYRITGHWDEVRNGLFAQPQN